LAASSEKRVNPRDPRISVLWIGESPGAEIERSFRDRKGTLYLLQHEAVLPSALELSAARALVIHLQKTAAICRLLQRLRPSATDFDVPIFVTVRDQPAREGLVATLQSRKLEVGSVEIVDPTQRESASRFAEVLARVQPRPSPRLDLEVCCEDSAKLTGQRVILIKRAFYDCKKVTLRPLERGYSADVFVAYATLHEGGARPLPFLIKFDKADKLEKERTNYEDHVCDYVQFSCRPNFVENRRALGHKEGVLVGNFVERSESLWDYLRRGGPTAALTSLFDDALRGWRQQAEGVGVTRDQLFSRLCSDFGTPAPRKTYVKTAVLRLKTPSVSALFKDLKAFPPVNFSTSPVHGDLHARNVRVDNSRAVLIDFAKTTWGPSLIDLASVEVSLAFWVNGPADAYKSWRKTVETLYSGLYFSVVPPLALEPRPREWLWNAVRQIRMVALASQKSSAEYQLAVIFQLLRHCSYPPDGAKDFNRRICAYGVATTLVRDLKSDRSRFQ
jgi:hypothetical protein